MFQKVFGAFLVVAGFLLIIKAEWFLENFGRIAWAEAKLGTEGGSRLMYKLIGLIFIFLGMTMVLDLYNGILLWIFGPLLLRK